MTTLVVFLAALAPVQVESPAAELAARVQQLVKQLDADAPEQRLAAEKALVELGPAALDHLPPITARTPAEVKERLGRVRGVLEEQAAAQAAQPTHVTLQAELPLADALTLIAEQTGNRLSFERVRGGNVTLDFAETPFWEALDRTLDQAGLTVNPYGGEPNALVLAARPPEEAPRFGPADYEGVFRFEAVRVLAVRDLRHPQVSGARLAVQIAWEPRVTPIALTQPIAALTAVDEHGAPLTVDAPQAVLGAAVQAEISAVELEFPFALPDRSVRRIASLRGRLQVTLPGRVETFEFADVQKAEGTVEQRAGVSVTLDRVRRNVDVWEVRFFVRFDDAAGALESHRGWIYNNEAYLLDAAGERIPYAGFEAVRQEANGVGLSYLFDLPKGPAGCRFVYRTPAAIVKREIEYELKDIPLP